LNCRGGVTKVQWHQSHSSSHLHKNKSTFYLASNLILPCVDMKEIVDLEPAILSRHEPCHVMSIRSTTLDSEVFNLLLDPGQLRCNNLERNIHRHKHVLGWVGRRRVSPKLQTFLKVRLHLLTHLVFRRPTVRTRGRIFQGSVGTVVNL
jgi:hypothetical protein